MADEVRWRLLYADGSSQDEADEGVYGRSIVDSKPGALVLQVVSWPAGVALADINVEGALPVFYRLRSLGALGGGEISTDAVVAGRARFDAEGQPRAQLWQLHGQALGPVASAAIAPTAIAWQASRGRL